MRIVTRTGDVRLSGEALPQVPVRATATPGQPGPGRKTWRRPDAEQGSRRPAAPAPVAAAPGEGDCPGTTARSQPSGCRWSSGGRSRWTACRTTLRSSLAQDDGFGVPTAGCAAGHGRHRPRTTEGPAGSAPEDGGRTQDQP